MREARNLTWTCHLHDNNDETANATPTNHISEDDADDTLEPPSTPPHVGLPCANPQCKKKMTRGTCPVTCMEPGCDNTFHKGCTNLTRSSFEIYRSGNLHWTCKQCLEKQEGTDSTTIHSQEPTEGKESTTKSKSRPSLRILQWNARGISNKMEELRTLVKDLNIDVITIQESHLKPTAKVPSIPGYSPIAAPRKNKDGGGLLSYVAKSITFQKIKDESKNATEVSTFSVKLKKNKWAKISNIYCPPDSHAYQPGFVQLRTDLIPASPNSIITGDVNAHSQLWDETQPSDARGDDIVEFLASNSLSMLNDGSPTRTNPSTGQGSSPDISLAGSLWSNKIAWSVIDNAMGSDHCPVLIELNCDVSHTPAFQGNPKWKLRDADWKSFREELEAAIQDVDTSLSLKEIITHFNQLVISAAEKHVGKAKPGKNSRVWLTPPVRAIIKRRNSLRHQIRTRKQEWLDACKEAREEIQRSREECWKEFLEDTISSGDDSKMWRLINSLNGTPSSNCPNETLIHKGKSFSSDRAKADIFAEYYAGVSSIDFTKEDRKTNRDLKQRLRSTAPEPAEPFTMKELTKAIRRMKTKGAAGPDDIPPSFIKNFGPLALEKLLEIFNISLTNGACPQVWRNAIIIPLLKANKPASKLESFRPISLTSCVVKVMERMLGERLYFHAEQQGMLSALQAGFRKKRSCEDQILKMTQAISDGFQSKPKAKHSVLVLLDFSKAYDTVWRQKLLTSLLDKGMPIAYVKWLHGFLQNRQARVRFGRELSSSRTMKQGLPQGSVLAPILFILYINNLAELLPDSTINTMYADDVSILGQSTSKEEAERLAQESVDIVVNWSKEWKLSLNAGKSEVSFFTRSPKLALHSPKIDVDGTTIELSPTPRLLGVILDQKLTFKAHLDKVGKDATKKLKMLAAISNSDWGWRKQVLRRCYLAHFRSMFDYAGSSWLPWISETNIQRLDRLQNQALRMISRQAKSSPLECLRLECEVPSYASVVKATCIQAREKAARLPEDHPRRSSLDQPATRRLDSLRCWRSESLRLSRHFIPNAEPRLPFASHSLPPWQRDVGSTKVIQTLPGIAGKDDDDDVIREAAYKQLQEINPAITIYTDGSASEGMSKGGAAAVICKGSPQRPAVIRTLKQKGARFTSSYDEEVRAMGLALDWIETNYNRKINICIVSDSQSLCQAIPGDDPELDAMRSRFRNLKCQLSIQWVPGHAGIAGNELADQAAKQAAELEGPSAPITFDSIKAEIKKATKDPAPHHDRTRQVYAFYSKKKEKEINSREDQSLLAKLRSGHTPILAAYKARIDPKANPTCQLCESGEDQTLEHWLTKCAGTLDDRIEHFGRDFDKLGSLTKYPVAAVALARATLPGAALRADPAGRVLGVGFAPR